MVCVPRTTGRVNFTFLIHFYTVSRVLVAHHSSSKGADGRLGAGTLSKIPGQVVSKLCELLDGSEAADASALIDSLSTISVGHVEFLEQTVPSLLRFQAAGKHSAESEVQESVNRCFRQLSQLKACEVWTKQLLGVLETTGGHKGAKRPHSTEPNAPTSKRVCQEDPYPPQSNVIPLEQLTDMCVWIRLA